MEQQWLSNVNQNYSKTSLRLDIVSAYLAKFSFISMEVLRKQRFLSQDRVIYWSPSQDTDFTHLQRYVRNVWLDELQKNLLSQTCTFSWAS